MYRPLHMPCEGVGDYLKKKFSTLLVFRLTCTASKVTKSKEIRMSNIMRIGTVSQNLYRKTRKTHANQVCRGKKKWKNKRDHPTIVSFSHWTNVLAGNNWNKHIPPTAANPNQNKGPSLVIFDLPRSVRLFTPFISFLFLILLIFPLLGTCGIIKNIQLTSDLIILSTQRFGIF